MPSHDVPALIRRSTLVVALLTTVLLVAYGSTKLLGTTLLGTPLESATRRALPGTSADEAVVPIAGAVLEGNLVDSASGSTSGSGHESNGECGLPRTPPPLLSEAELDAGIRRVDDAHYTLARRLRDKVLSASSELMRLARVIPYEENGRMVGVKLHGVRRVSLLGKLGVENGDIVHSVNGFALSSPESLPEAYAKLLSLKHLRVTLSRHGEKRTLECHVQ